MAVEVNTQPGPPDGESFVALRKPSAPPPSIYPALEEKIELQNHRIDPSAPSDEKGRQNFQLQIINERMRFLKNEVDKYREVAKKYKKAKKAVDWTTAICSGLSAALSSASFGSALSVVGLPAAVPLGGTGGLLALCSSGLVVCSRKIDSKIKKHQEITTLALAKKNTVDRMVLAANRDKNVSDKEFADIQAEVDNYESLKNHVRAKLHRQPSRRHKKSFSREVSFQQNAEGGQTSVRYRRGLPPEPLTPAPQCAYPPTPAPRRTPMPVNAGSMEDIAEEEDIVRRLHSVGLKLTTVPSGSP